MEKMNQETIRTEAMAVWAIVGSITSIFGNLLVMHLSTLTEVVKWYALCFAIASVFAFIWYKIKGGVFK